MKTTFQLLVIDDDSVDRIAVARATDELGWKLVQTQTLAQAEAVLGVTDGPSFDCLLLDFSLPEGDGHQSLARLAAQGINVPVVLLTGIEDAEVVVELLGEGAAGYLPKRHLSADRLRKVVLRATQAHRAEHLREQAEKRLAEQEGLFRAVLEQMPAGILVVNAAGRILFRNDRFLTLIGEDLAHARSVEEMAAMASGPVAPEGRADLLASLAGASEGSHDFRLRKLSGRYVVRVRQGQVRGPTESGTPTLGRVDVFDDVTDLLAAENYQQQIIAIAGHDLRNPLAAITTNAVLLSRDGPMPDDKRARGAQRILSSARRMHRMLEDLFDYTVATLGKGIPVNFAPTDLATLCEDAATEARAAFPERALTVELTGDLRGEWDSDRLHQVLQNLLGNAFKYGDPAHAIVLRAREDSQEGHESVVIDVINLGQPIDPGLLPHMFDAYRRGGGPGGQRSLGLGLYIARRILDAHHGTIGATSSHAEGTRIEVVLPKHPGRLSGARSVITPPRGLSSL